MHWGPLNNSLSLISKKAENTIDCQALDHEEGLILSMCQSFHWVPENVRLSSLWLTCTDIHLWQWQSHKLYERPCPLMTQRLYLGFITRVVECCQLIKGVETEAEVKILFPWKWCCWTLLKKSGQEPTSSWREGEGGPDQTQKELNKMEYKLTLYDHIQYRKYYINNCSVRIIAMLFQIKKE